MSIPGSRIAAAVVVPTTLICVVAVAGDGPVRTEPEPYTPTHRELEEIGVISSEFPVPGALPPEIFPAEAWGLGPQGPPAWLLWALGAVLAAAIAWVGVQLVREVLTWRIRWRRPRLRGWRRRRPAAASEPAPAESEEEAEMARHAIDAALEPLREPADARAAVIEAYVRMEAVLAERRLGRGTAEAPREYLRRVLRERGMPEGSLSTLTALFEEARFSRHPIPASAPRRAAGELETARIALTP